MCRFRRGRRLWLQLHRTIGIGLAWLFAQKRNQAANTQLIGRSIGIQARHQRIAGLVATFQLGNRVIGRALDQPAKRALNRFILLVTDIGLEQFGMRRPDRNVHKAENAGLHLIANQLLGVGAGEYHFGGGGVCHHQIDRHRHPICRLARIGSQEAIFLDTVGQSPIDLGDRAVDVVVRA